MQVAIIYEALIHAPTVSRADFVKIANHAKIHAYLFDIVTSQVGSLSHLSCCVMGSRCCKGQRRDALSMLTCGQLLKWREPHLGPEQSRTAAAS